MTSARSVGLRGCTTGPASALSRSPDSSSVGSETAEEVSNRIAAQAPTASLVTVYTEDNDPNRLLGRPNGNTRRQVA